MRAHGVERRWIALIRSRTVLLTVAGFGSVAIASSFAVALEADQRARGVVEIVMFGSALLTVILAHGMVAADVRSGVAMLWLQKPVRAVPFFTLRAAEVTALAAAVVIALWGVGAALLALSAGANPARELLTAVPAAAALVVCFCTLTFAFSGWGVPTDSVLTLLFFIGGTLALAMGGPLASATHWVALPVDALAPFADFRSTTGMPLGEAAWRIARFLLIWGLAGLTGLAVTTRSPLPKESAR